MGQKKWYQSIAYDFLLLRWTFLFNLKGLCSLKGENVFSALRGTLLWRDQLI
jgi:hypothetical protein